MYSQQVRACKLYAADIHARANTCFDASHMHMVILFAYARALYKKHSLAIARRRACIYEIRAFTARLCVCVRADCTSTDTHRAHTCTMTYAHHISDCVRAHKHTHTQTNNQKRHAWNIRAHSTRQRQQQRQRKSHSNRATDSF